MSSFKRSASPPQQPLSLSSSSPIITSYPHSTIPPLSHPTRQPSSSTTTTTPSLAAQTSRIPPIHLPILPPRPEAAHSTDHDPRVVFTRQLWQRSMPHESADVPVSRQQSHSAAPIAPETSTNTARGSFDTGVSRRTSSSVSTRSLRHPPSSPSAGSKTPLTPEESPPFRTTRKRAISILDEEDRAFDSAELSPLHARTNSVDLAAQVCICQPDPKIPRPRNAFILYRQHHQAKVIADHPGLANPDISKIIGEQWRNQPAEVKNEWKRLAEEEKIRHQQQYPQYRYQPKRNTRRNSLNDTPTAATGEKARCQKCGGRTVIAPGSYPSNSQTRDHSPTSASLPPQTPTSSTTPTSRTLPVLRDLTLQSPASRRMVRPFPPSDMPGRHITDRDDEFSPMSPDSKRRRFNTDHPVTMYRSIPPRYAVAPLGTAMSPGTQYTFAHAPQPHPYPSAQLAQSAHARRESLPSLHMMSPPGPMGPPPRPGMGYQQHRLSQGHAAPDRSLTLPPLQGSSTASSSPATRTGDSKSAKEVIMSLPLALKLEVLRQIAPPAAFSGKDKPRGPLIAVEGDSPVAAQDLAKWLAEMLSKEEEINVTLIDPPDIAAKGDEEDAMAEYHLLAASWLKKSRELAQQLNYDPPPERASIDTTEAQPVTAEDESGANRASDAASTDNQSPGRSSRMSIDSAMDNRPIQVSANDDGAATSAEKGDSSTQSTQAGITKTVKPVLIAPTFSLHATNVFSCRIPMTDAYGPKEHWQWNATLWRGIIGPDLTIYVRDAEEGDQRRSVEPSEGERLFMVKRSGKDGGEGMEVDGATLRRVGFEVSEWIRAFGTRRN